MSCRRRIYAVPSHVTAACLGPFVSCASLSQSTLPYLSNAKAVTTYMKDEKGKISLPMFPHPLRKRHESYQVLNLPCESAASIEGIMASFGFQLEDAFRAMNTQYRRVYELGASQGGTPGETCATRPVRIQLCVALSNPLSSIPIQTPLLLSSLTAWMRCIVVRIN